jgi:hypothetical protein
MAIVNRLLSTFSDFVRVGFAGAAVGQTYNAYNVAVAYQFKHAVTGQYPNYQIDYAKLLVTSGPLCTEGINPAVIRTGNQLAFTWSYDPGQERGTDHVMLLAYCLESNQTTYNLCGAKRYTETETLILPGDAWQGKPVETYISLREENGVKCMNSIYCCIT